MTQTATSAAVERKLALTRVFDAPRDLVFRAWTDPKQLAQWWGPTGFTNPLCELDLRPFGEIRIDMRAPNGTVYPMSGAFREIVEPERLVFTTAALDSGGKPLFENLNTVTFEALEGGRTLLTVNVRVLWESLEAAPYLAGMHEGWSRTIDRLADFVAPDASSREIRTSRFFKAPRPLVYQMWTQPEHIVQWWGPTGFTTTIHHMDVRPGGEWRLTLHGPDGTAFENHKVYEEVIPQERLTINHLSWPHHRMYVRFTDAEGGTDVAVQMIFEAAADYDKVVTEFGAVKGLAQTLDRLAERLGRL